ncbi:MAG: hypothetical protein ABIT71_05090 [Vicinamibacteraceae bacterium]
MSGTDAWLERLERASDRLSPIVVKEVRQLARGREFHYSFNLALLVGLAVAFFGAADSLGGSGTSGRWTFAALTGALGLLGFAVVPLGAFNALRNERMEQTLELITLTALSPRRVVIGKLLAQGVKLATLFAGLAPFIAMSFLLGGVDFATILVSMLVIVMWSLCLSAACLFLSALVTSRAMSGFLFGAVGIVVLLALLVFGAPGAFYVIRMRGGMHGSFAGGMGAGGATSWWTLAASTAFCVALIVNLVLLAENRLLLPSQNRSTALRLGFLAQLLLIAPLALSAPGSTWSDAGRPLLGFGVIHLAIVAAFTVTEDLVLPRRVLLARQELPSWRRVLAPLQPGGGNGALYVLLQMAALLALGWVLQTDRSMLHWFVVACGYICFFTGAPVVIFRAVRPIQSASFRLRLALIVVLAGAMLMPDVLAYMLWQPDGLDLKFSLRHLLNPFRTLANFYGASVPYRTLAELIGITGALAYVVLIRIGAGVTLEPVPDGPDEPEAAAGEPDGANVLS